MRPTMISDKECKDLILHLAARHEAALIRDEYGYYYDAGQYLDGIAVEVEIDLIDGSWHAYIAIPGDGSAMYDLKYCYVFGWSIKA